MRDICYRDRALRINHEPKGEPPGETRRLSLERDNDLAFRASSLHVGHGLLGRCEREDSIYNWSNDSVIDERCDLGQLVTVRSHEEERVVDLAALSFCSDPVAQGAHDHSQDP